MPRNSLIFTWKDRVGYKDISSVEGESQDK